MAGRPVPGLDTLVGEACTDGTRFASRLRNKLVRHARVLSKELVEQIRFVYDAFRNPDTPAGAKLVMLAALAYFVLPTDALPDFLPVLGFSDDAVLVGFALKKLGEVLGAQRARTGAALAAAAGASDSAALQLDLTLARREAGRLAREAARWRRMTVATAALLVVLSFVYLWSGRG